MQERPLPITRKKLPCNIQRNIQPAVQPSIQPISETPSNQDPLSVIALWLFLTRLLRVWRSHSCNLIYNLQWELLKAINKILVFELELSIFSQFDHVSPLFPLILLNNSPSHFEPRPARDKKECGNLHFFEKFIRLLRSFHSLALTLCRSGTERKHQNRMAI